MIDQVAIDLERNPKQYEYFCKVLMACKGLLPYRKFAYGGAIRGGKTVVSFAAILTLANRYPGSKWHTFRESFTQLQQTAIPSFEKIIRGSTNWKWNKERANYFAYNRKDSKVFFIPESISSDPNLDKLLGLETNGVFLEQLEGLSKKLWEVSSSRVGSWYIDPMPPGLMLTTFNPTQLWPKEFIYKKWLDGELPADFYFQKALPQDNAFVTADQWSNWSQMDERYQKQFVEGDWTNFDAKDNRFAYAFNEDLHVGQVTLDPRREVFLSFDFNHDPITCSVWQNYDNTIWGVEQIKLGNSNIYELLEYYLVNYPRVAIQVTGDATGRASSALVKDNSNYYTVIKKVLNLSPTQLKVPGANPSLADNRVLVNAVLHRYKVVLDKVKMRDLIFDLKNVRVHPDGSIIKDNRKDPTQQADCLDTFRYYLNAFFGWFLKT